MSPALLFPAGKHQLGIDVVQPATPQQPPHGNLPHGGGGAGGLGQAEVRRRHFLHHHPKPANGELDIEQR